MMRPQARAGRGFTSRGLKKKPPGERNRSRQPARGITRTTIINRYGVEEEVEINGDGVYVTPAPKGPERKRAPSDASSSLSGELLDGFVLMGACMVEDPSHAIRAKLCARSLIEVAEEDMQLFPNLSYLDLGDNRIPFYQMASLPSLETLLMPCNHISELEVPSRSFANIQYLDLAFNKLSLQAIASLMALPCLRVLDLTGNGLGDVPADMSGFSVLERLDLDQNRLADPRILNGLASIKSLKELNLTKNQLEFLPDMEEGFDSLEILHLASNLIEYEEDVLPCVNLPKLHTLHLWDNPVVVKQRGYPPVLYALLTEGRGITLLKEQPVEEKPQPRVNHDLLRAVADPKRPRGKRRTRAENADALIEAARAADRREDEQEQEATREKIATEPVSAKVVEEDALGGSFFLTQVDQYEDVASGAVSPAALPPIATGAPFSEDELFTRFNRSKKKPNQRDVQQAMADLRFTLNHPTLATADNAAPHHTRTTHAAKLRRKAVDKDAEDRRRRVLAAERRDVANKRPASAAPAKATPQPSMRTMYAHEDEEESYSDVVEELDELLAGMKDRLSLVESNLAEVLGREPLSRRSNNRNKEAAALLKDAEERYTAAYQDAIPL